MALEYVKFYRGIRELYDAEGEHFNGIYFATDTKELLMNGEAYGTDTMASISYTPPDTIVFDNGVEPITIVLQTAAAGDSVDDSVAGLISAEDIYKLATALDDSKDYTDEQIAALKEELSADIAAEENRAEDRENELAADIEAEVTRATNAEDTIATNLADEIERATTAEETLQTNLTAEEARATAEEEKLQEEIDNLSSELSTFESTTETNLTNLQNTLESEISDAITTTEAYTDSEISSLKDTLEAEINSASSGATDYTDEKIAALDYSDSAETSQFVTSVSETDGIIAVTREAITGADAIKVSDYQISLALNGNDILSQNSSGLKATLSIKYDDTNHTVQLLGYDDTLVSEFDATEFIIDGMIQSAKLVTVNPETGATGEFIALTFNTEHGETTTMYIDVTDLIDIYTGGNGITIDSDKVVAIKIADSSDGYLGVSSAGLYTSGIDSAISSAVATETSRAEAAEDSLQSAIDSLSGSTSTDISDLQAAVKTAQSTADDAVSAASTAQSTADSATTAASNAQSTADNAVSAAATAQTTADNAATAASNAQSTAEAANTAASAAQSTADSATTAASNAQTTANQGVSDAAAASTAASNAQSTADEALSLAQEASSTYVKKAGDTMSGKLTISSSTASVLSVDSGTTWNNILLSNTYNGLNHQTMIGQGNNNDFVIRVYNDGNSSSTDLRLNQANSTVKWNSNNLLQSSTAVTVWTGTESEYNALSSYSDTTLYIIKKS